MELPPLTTPESIEALQELTVVDRLEALTRLVEDGRVHVTEAADAWLLSGGDEMDVALIYVAHRARQADIREFYS